MAAGDVDLQFTALKTAGLDGGSQILDTQIGYIAKAFQKLGALIGRPGGLVPLRSNGTIDPAFLGELVTPATLHVSATAGANTAVTATLPAVAGKVHLITAIQLVRAATVAVLGGALLVTTSTNLPGSPAWTAGNVINAGQAIIDLDYQPANPLQASVAGTATTIVMPAAGANVVNRINVSYLLVDA
jgi:hypothetical protein